MSVTLVVFQVLTLLLKAEANWNMALMFETLAVSQPPAVVSSAAPPLLKAEANWNMALMFVTLAVSQLLTFWLKEVAPSSV